MFQSDTHKVDFFIIQARTVFLIKGCFLFRKIYLVMDYFSYEFLSKVGTTTLINTLTNISKLSPKLNLKKQTKRGFIHSKIFTLPKEKSLNLNHTLNFVFVRHPFDRLASAYYDKIPTLKETKAMKLLKHIKFLKYRNQAIRKFQ